MGFCFSKLEVVGDDEYYRLPSEVGSDVGAVPWVWPVLFLTPDGALMLLLAPPAFACEPDSMPLVPGWPAPEVPPVPLLPVALVALVSLAPVMPVDTGVAGTAVVVVAVVSAGAVVVAL